MLRRNQWFEFWRAYLKSVNKAGARRASLREMLLLRLHHRNLLLSRLHRQPLCSAQEKRQQKLILRCARDLLSLGQLCVCKKSVLSLGTYRCPKISKVEPALFQTAYYYRESPIKANFDTQDILVISHFTENIMSIWKCQVIWSQRQYYCLLFWNFVKKGIHNN